MCESLGRGPASLRGEYREPREAGLILIPASISRSRASAETPASASRRVCLLPHKTRHLHGLLCMILSSSLIISRSMPLSNQVVDT